MKKTTKNSIVIAMALVLIGVVISFVAMEALDYDTTKLTTYKTMTTRYEFTKDEDFNTIDIECDSADIVIKKSTDDKCYIESQETDLIHHEASVKNGILTISDKQEDKGPLRLASVGISMPQQKIVISLPKSSYDALTIQTDVSDVEVPEEFTFGEVNIAGDASNISFNAQVVGKLQMVSDTGDININGLKASDIYLETETGAINVSATSVTGRINVSANIGDVNLSDVSCGDLKVEDEAGEIKLIHVVATNGFDVENEVGDIILESCDAKTLTLENETGDITGSLLSEKNFIAETEVGDIDVPHTTKGGVCNINTEIGDIKMTLAK